MQPQNIYPTPEGQHSGESPAGQVGTHETVHHQPIPQPINTFSPLPTNQNLENQANIEVPNDKPIAVLEVLSVRGVEYGMMTLVLWVGAITLTWILLNMVNGSRGFDYVVVPTSALVVCVPVFGWFFLRLKKAELADPKLRFDPSKRRWSQITQILSYTVVLVNLIYFVYVVLSHFSKSHGSSIVKALVNLVVITIVAGGVLAYYWFDEHRLLK
jgi:hypothetical protein